MVDWKRTNIPLGAKVVITCAKARRAYELADAIRAEVLRREPRATVYVSDSVGHDGKDRWCRLHVIAYVTAIAIGVRDRGSIHVERIDEVRRAVERACVSIVFAPRASA